MCYSDDSMIIQLFIGARGLLNHINICTIIPICTWPLKYLMCFSNSCLIGSLTDEMVLAITGLMIGLEVGQQPYFRTIFILKEAKTIYVTCCCMHLIKYHYKYHY